MPGRRWLALAPPLLAALLLLGSAAPVSAGYQATVDVNDTAFDPTCLGFEDSYPEKLYTAALAAYRALGYATSGYTGAPFTRTQVLGRTASDWGYYVHSHGYRYYDPRTGGYDSGFKEDAGRCSAATIYARDIRLKRAGRQSNLVVMSTCYLGDASTTMPAAFAIEKVKAGSRSWNGPEFYLGYRGEAWDSDEWTFETRFWDALLAGRGVGAAFDLALGAGGWRHPFGADWWGSYIWSGRAGPGSTCPNCV